MTPVDWPDGLREAYDAYERALGADDLDALDRFFEPTAVRTQDGVIRVGTDELRLFRAARGGVAARRISRVELRHLADDVMLIAAESTFAGGGRGAQTQLWRRSGTDWLIVGAHVDARTSTFDRAVWRVVGDPLLRGAATGPLAGQRVAVKDLFAVAGHVVGAGNPTWTRHAPTETAHAGAVAELLDAGADIVGIARTDEFAYSIAGRNAHTGTPTNPAAPTRIPGGSTSGSAVAVASGVADIALGTDTAGSIRIPASYQGLWGLRTTHGRVGRDGVLPLAQTFDTIGWITRDSDTLAAAAGATMRAAESPDEQLDTVILVAPALTAAADPATAAAFTEWLERSRLHTTHVDLPDIEELASLLATVQGAEAWRNHGTWVGAHRAQLGSDVRARFDRASTISAEAETAARRALVEHRAAIRRTIGRGVLLLPTAPGPAPSCTADAEAVDAVRTRTLRMTALAGIGGLPAVSAPALTVDAAPVGVCLVGAPNTDLALIDRAVELVDAALHPEG